MRRNLQFFGGTLLFLLLEFFGNPARLSAQQSNLSCSLTPVPFVNGGSPSFTVTAGSTASGLSGWTGVPNAVDASLSNAATGTIAATGSLSLRVSDAVYDYNAGNFAGFLMGGGLVNLSALGSVTVTTYLNNAAQESRTGANLVALSSGLLAGSYELGFYTNLPFDAVEVAVSNGIGAGTFNVYAAILRGTGSCTGALLTCNEPNRLQFPARAVVLEPSHSGVSGALATGAILNPEAVTDNVTTNYASLTTTASVLGSAALAVKDVSATYPAGTYAAFDIGNATLLSAAALGGLTIRTYNNGAQQEAATGTGLLLGSTVLANSGRQPVGFVTTLPFDEVQIQVTQTAGLSLGETRIYAAVLRRFCAGPALACNTATAPAENDYPVYVNSARTGISGGVCAACNVSATGNLLDGDAATAAVIDLTAGALVSGSVSVKNELTDYPAGTLAAFDLANPALLNINLLSNLTVTTYLDGAQQQTISGTGLLAAAPSSLIAGGGRMTVGLVSSLPFDELRLSVVQTTGVNLGTTLVYSPVLENFCAGTIGCNSTYFLSSPAYPVVIDAARTGVSGAACVACAVENAERVLSADTTDFARLVTTAGVAAGASIAVQDAVSTYPAGTVAGFAIRDPASLLEADLLRTLRITTYLDGAQQETRAGGQLLDLSAILLYINPAAGNYRLGFVTTLPFDEIRLTAAPLAAVTPLVEVYGAFVDTRFIDPATNPLACAAAPLAEPDHVSTLVNTAVTGNLRTNDRDPRGLALTYNTAAATAPQNGIVSITTAGGFTYTPAAGFTGLDSFVYTVCNSTPLCSSATAYVSVLPARIPGGPNRPPVAQPDYSETQPGVPVSDHANKNDNDPDGHSMTYTLVTPPLRGLLVVNPDGTYTYTPDSSFTGRQTALLQVCDSGSSSLCTNSVLYLDILPDLNGTANDRPAGHDDVKATPVNTLLVGNVVANDSDPNGDVLTATALDAPPAGSGSLSLGSDGQFSYMPATGFTGTVSVRYRIYDGGSTSPADTATLTITVPPVQGPDFTPSLMIDSTSFSSPLQPRDFVLDVQELLGASSAGPLVVRIIKPSGFAVTYAANTATAAVNGGTGVNNADWTFTENTLFITCTLKPGVVVPANGRSRIGFAINRKSGTPPNTVQNLTATILSGTGGDSNNQNNQATLVLRTR